MIRNPIIRGFNPDPSIVRAGDDYYIVNSTFEWWPGARLYHSRNLAVWEDMGGILDDPSLIDLTGTAPSCGVWACDLSYDGRRFYLVYTDVKTKKYYYNTHNYLIYADDIRGPWSGPVYLNSRGFDPSLFHDADGRKYLVGMLNGFKGITIQKLDPDTMEPEGEAKVIFEGSGIGCTEGPHLYRIGEYYYLITAEGGTGYDHCVSVARSRDLYGPYEVHPGNPLITSSEDSPLRKCGHGDIVFDKDGRSFIVFLCSRPVSGSSSVLGRETAIEELVWKDGWPYLKRGGRIPGTEVEYEHSTENVTSFYDDFSGNGINKLYSSPRRSFNEFASVVSNKIAGGFALRIIGRESLNSLFRVSLLSCKLRETDCRACTKLLFSSASPEQAAGLAIVYDALNFYIFVQTSEDDAPCLKLIKSDRGVIETLETAYVTPGEDGIELSAELSGGKDLYFEYRTGGEPVRMKTVCDASILSDEYCRGFTGTQAGMYVHDLTGSGKAAEFLYFSTEDKK